MTSSRCRFVVRTARKRLGVQRARVLRVLNATDVLVDLDGVRTRARCGSGNVTFLNPTRLAHELVDATDLEACRVVRTLV